MSDLDPSKVISCIKSEEGVFEYHILGVGTWDHFDSLVNFFKKYYSAEVCSQQDRIYTRQWTLRVDDEIFTLYHHEDIGNYFNSSLFNGKSGLMEVFSEDLTQRLKNVGYE